MRDKHNACGVLVRIALALDGEIPRVADDMRICHDARAVYHKTGPDAATDRTGIPRRAVIGFNLGGGNANETFLNSAVRLFRSRHHNLSDRWGSWSWFQQRHAFLGRRRQWWCILLRRYRGRRILLLQRGDILLRKKLSARKKQDCPNEKTFHPKAGEDETARLKCKLPIREANVDGMTKEIRPFRCGKLANCSKLASPQSSPSKRKLPSGSDGISPSNPCFVHWQRVE